MIQNRKAETWITLQEAAQRAGRSYSWARDRAADGRFERLSLRGRVLVSASDVGRHIATGYDRRSDETFDWDLRKRPRLRLVIDNDK